jgi:outer membrane receptor protein involved in Fe transport
MNTTHVVAMWLTIGVLLGVSTASTPARGDEADSAELSDIVITAQKTSEPLSQVPISIAVVSGDTLADEHITDYADLSRSVPNLSFTSFGGPGQSNIEIRGISSQAGSATTGIYLDDVPINVLNIYTTGATEPRFFDIDRVKAPVGTRRRSKALAVHFEAACSRKGTNRLQVEGVLK